MWKPMECLETEESRFVSVQQRKQLEDGFAEAINRGDFTTFYQPKVETDTLRIVGAEAISQENIWQIRICLRTLWIFCINMKWRADTLN